MYNNYNPYFSYNRPRGFNVFPKGMSGTKINWKSILNGTQKTLNIVNQAIPLIYQIKPIFNNAKTIFKVMSTVKEDDKINTKTEEKKSTTNYNNSFKQDNNNMAFFL